MDAPVKLLQRTSRYYLPFSVGLLLLLGTLLFLLLRWSLDRATDESLRKTAHALHRQLEKLESLPARVEIMDEIVELQPIRRAGPTERFSDTLIFDERPEEQELEPYRKYTFQDTIRGRPYRISINHSRVEDEDLVYSIAGVLLFCLALALLAFTWFNRWLSGRLWSPFQRTLEVVRAFDLTDDRAPDFGHSDTEEFEELNRSLERMTERLSADYHSLRRFTENASHELQTPLAIIRGHVDVLLQGEERSERDYRTLQGISEAVSRLSRLQQTLLLLTRIENDQFPAAALVDLQPLLAAKLEQLEPALTEQEIRVEADLSPAPVRLPPPLADVLLNNLLSNAIRHNTRGGFVRIRLDRGVLSIVNSGPPPGVPAEAVFDRFVHGPSAASSLGLGLALVREICDRFGLSVTYDYAGDHTVRLTLPEGR